MAVFRMREFELWENNIKGVPLQGTEGFSPKLGTLLLNLDSQFSCRSKNKSYGPIARCQKRLARNEYNKLHIRWK